MARFERTRLDKVWLDDSGRRFGQFEVSDLDLMMLTPTEAMRSVFTLAYRLGLDIRTLTKTKLPDRCAYVIYGQMRHDFQQEDETVAYEVSNRRHIDLSIVE